jgi:hypothetical protein
VADSIRPIVLLLLLAASGCEERPAPPPPPAATEAAPGATPGASATEIPSAQPSAAASAAPATPARDRVTLIAAGDACFGRLVGQEILKDPTFNPFTSSAALLESADIRFVNMESQLSDQKGETQSPTQKLVFTGPPGGADALARGHIDIVSAANNHMWDYGRNAFFETLDNL